MSDPASVPELAVVAAELRARGITRVRSFAWRDLDDPEAGGSEVHADRILSRWASAGVDVEHRTSTADAARSFERNGYRVVQRGGRYDVFARVIARELVRRRDPASAVIEIWNGVPWFGPLWAGRRRVTWMHHVHRHMWADSLPSPLHHGGRLLETRLAPPCYRRTTIATLSASSRDEILELGMHPERVVVVPPGVDGAYRPDASRREPTPLVVAVGRLAPVKRFDAVLDAVRRARVDVGELRVEIIGDGPERRALEDWVARHDASSWATVRGRVSDAELVAAYQRAWLVTSASYAEGWGMSLTEAAACATPAVATDIAGHRGAVDPGRTGDLVPIAELGSAIAALIGDAGRRTAYATAALDHAAGLSWDVVAARHLQLVVDACV